MMRKLFLRVWLGDLPVWYDKWQRAVEPLHKYGWDFYVCNDTEEFQERCRAYLGMLIDPQPGTRKPCEYDPAGAVLFPDKVDGYDFWGHCNLDVVYGRLDRFITDEYLKDCDIFGNDPGAICGPCTLYRNDFMVNNLFRTVPGWREIFASRSFHGFDEGAFNSRVQELGAQGAVRFKSAFWQAHDKQEWHFPKPQVQLLEDGRLLDRGRLEEIAMFHFNRVREWPLDPKEK